MIQKVAELNRAGKLLLLEAIASGKIDKNQISQDSLVATEYKDAFLLLMMSEKYKSPCICLGLASMALKEIMGK